MFRPVLLYPYKLQSIEIRPPAVPCLQSSQVFDIFHVRKPETGGIFFRFGVYPLIQCVFSSAGGTAGAPLALEAGQFRGVAGKIAEGASQTMINQGSKKGGVKYISMRACTLEKLKGSGVS